jgi:hypothetical protein
LSLFRQKGLNARAERYSEFDFFPYDYEMVLIG